MQSRCCSVNRLEMTLVEVDKLVSKIGKKTLEKCGDRSPWNTWRSSMRHCREGWRRWFPSVRPSMRPSVHASVPPSIRPSAHPSVRSYVHSLWKTRQKTTLSLNKHWSYALIWCNCISVRMSVCPYFLFFIRQNWGKTISITEKPPKQQVELR